MIRGTTPTITCNVNYDFSTCDKVRLSLSDGSHRIDIDMANLLITETTVTATLTQEQTLKLESPRVRVQLSAVKGSTALATREVAVNLDDVLDEEVL